MSITEWIAHQYDTIIHSGFPIFFWVRPEWSTSDIPDQTGRVVLITGGNSGTGYATCKALYEKGAKVYLCCRDTQRGKEAIEGIKKGGVFGPSGLTFPSFTPVKSNGSLECLELDLADLNSISRFVDDFTSRENKLDVLFANAGVMASAEGQYTKQGYTLQFGTNCLGHQRLISLLLPRLLSGSSSSSPSRIISLSSAGHSMAPSKGFDPPSVLRPQNYDQEHPKKGPNEYSKWVEYGQSKWGNVAIVKYLHWLYGPDQGKAKKSVKGEKVAKGEVISIAIHPGMVATNLARHLSLTEVILKKIPWFASLITRPAEIGASNQLWAATCPDDRARQLSGEYVVPFQHVGVARPDLENPRKIQELWDWCEEQGKRHV